MQASKRLNRHLKTGWQGENVPFFAGLLAPEIAQLAALPSLPPKSVRGRVVLPQTCRHAAAARVRGACSMHVFLLLGKATRGARSLADLGW